MVDGVSENPDVKGRLLVGHRREEIDEAQVRVLEILDRRGYDRAARFAVRVAVEEALANAIQHGNRSDPTKSVRLDYVVADDSVIIDVQDEGRGFDPDAVPDPTRQENLDIPSGRGIMLMRAYMTDVRFHPPGNRVRMVLRKA